MTNDAAQTPAKSPPERLNPWIQLVLGLATAGGIIWAALLFFDPIGDLDVTVRILEEVPVTLPKELDAPPLELRYRGSRITRALFLTLEVSNTGNQPIGTDADPWMLSIRSAGGAQVSRVGPLRVKPSNLVVKAKTPGSDRIGLQIGLLNPGDVIGVDVMVIDPPTDEKPPLVAETRVPGLEAPAVTRLNIRERLQHAFRGPAWVTLGLIMFAGLLWEANKRRELTAGRAFLALFLSLFSSGIIAGGLAWLLSVIAAVALHG